MTKNEKDVILAKSTIAYYSGYAGIEIKDIEYGIEDYIIFVAGAWCSNKTVHRVKVYYGVDRPYFKYYGNRIYLDDCLRV